MKTITQSMVHVLRSLQETDDHVGLLSSLSVGESNALYECVNSKYVKNISVFCLANGKYDFSSNENVYLTQAGSRFLCEQSLRYKITQSVFDTLRGIKGFLIGVVTGVVANHLYAHLDEILAWLRLL